MSRLSFGVTKPMALWRCSSLYHATNRSTHAHAASIDSKGLRGYDGTYFNVRKSASEYGLSSLTLGRLNDGMMPSHGMVASIVAPFIGPPLSECSVSVFGSTSCSGTRGRAWADSGCTR